MIECFDQGTRLSRGYVCVAVPDQPPTPPAGCVAVSYEVSPKASEGGEASAVGADLTDAARQWVGSGTFSHDLWAVARCGEELYEARWVGTTRAWTKWEPSQAV